MLIYLNRTGFNGLFRVNARGAFNVPAGRYERPNIVDREKLARVAAALSAPGVRLVWGSFEVGAATPRRPGDFLYFDPPYAPLSAHRQLHVVHGAALRRRRSGRLQQVVIELARRGCQVLLSNSTAGEIAALYETNAEARARRAARAARAGAPRHQQQRRAPRRRRRVPDHEHRARDCTVRLDSARAKQVHGCRPMRAARCASARLHACTLHARIGWSRMLLSGIAGRDARRNRAKVAELADAPDLGSGSRKAMGVRLPPFALLRSPGRTAGELRSAGTLSTLKACRAEAAQPRRWKAHQHRDHENRIRRCQRDAQERARRNPHRCGERRDRSRRAGLFPQGARARLPSRARRRPASSSSASRTRSCTTSRTT